MQLYRGAILCHWIPRTRYRRETPRIYSSHAARNTATQLHEYPTLPQCCLSLHEWKFEQNYQAVVVFVSACHRSSPPRFLWAWSMFCPASNLSMAKARPVQTRTSHHPCDQAMILVVNRERLATAFTAQPENPATRMRLKATRVAGSASTSNHDTLSVDPTIPLQH